MSDYDAIISGLILIGLLAILCWSIGGLFQSVDTIDHDEHEDIDYANWQNTIPKGE